MCIKSITNYYNGFIFSTEINDNENVDIKIILKDLFYQSLGVQ